MEIQDLNLPSFLEVENELELIDENDNDKGGDSDNKKLQDKSGGSETPEGDGKSDKSDDSTGGGADKTDDKDNKEDDVNAQAYIEHYKTMKALGLIQLSDEFEFDESKPEESLSDMYRQHANMMDNTLRDRLIESMPQQFKDVISYGLAGGQDFDQFVQIEKGSLELGSLDLNNEAQVSQLIATFHEGMPEKYRNQMIEDLKTDGKLFEEGKKIYDQLDKQLKDRKAEMTKQAQIARQEKEAKDTKFAKDVYEYTRAQQWKKEAKNTVINSIFNQGKSSLASKVNQAWNNPEHIVQLARLFASYDPAKGFDISSLGTQAKQVKESLKDIFAASGGANPKRANQSNQPNDGDEGFTLY